MCKYETTYIDKNSLAYYTHLIIRIENMVIPPEIFVLRILDI